MGQNPGPDPLHHGLDSRWGQVALGQIHHFADVQRRLLELAQLASDNLRGTFKSRFVNSFHVPPAGRIVDVEARHHEHDRVLCCTC